MTVVFLVLAALGGIVYVIVQKYERSQSATTTDATAPEAPAPRRDWLGFVGTSAQLLGQVFKIAWILLGMGLVILIIITAITTTMNMKH